MLLLVGMSLVLVVMGLGLGRSQDGESALRIMRMEAAAESGARIVLAQHMMPGKGGRDSAPTKHSLEIDGFLVEVSLQAADGLIGMRSAEQDLLRDAVIKLLRLSSSRADQLVTRMRGARTYSELLSVEGLDSQALGCLLSYMTLYSQRAKPIAALAPVQVRSLVGLREERRSEINDEGAIANVPVIRVMSSVNDGKKRSRPLVMEVLVTGQARMAVKTLEWFWGRDEDIHAESKSRAFCGSAY